MNPNAPYNTGALKNMVSKVRAYCAHIIPLVFDNTLSYYETICACVGKINECCDAINAQNLTIVEFTHMVEVELDKFEQYVQQELSTLGDRVTELETAVEGIRSAIDTINTELGYKVDKRTDVTDTVVENSMQVITSGGIYHALRNDIPDATHNSKGVVQIGDGILVADGIISPRLADKTRTGIVKVGDNIDVNSGTISVPDATHNSKGVVQIGDGILVADGIISPRLADKTRTGVVKVGDNIDVNSGTISVPDGDYNVKGSLSVGANLTVYNGEVDVPVASTLQKGVMAVGNGLTANSGVVSVNVANTVEQGNNNPVSSNAVYEAFQNVPIEDATYLNKGIITVEALPADHALTLTNGVLGVNDATSSVKGVVKIGDNIDVNSGTISVPEADNVTKGVVGINPLDTNLTLNNGILNVPTATKNNKGVVQVGSHISVSNGVIDVPLADDTGGAYGLVAPSLNSAITATDGVIDVKNATTATKGAVTLTNTVQSGDTTHVPTADAVYNAVTGAVPPQIADATTSSKGIVQIGSNINVNSGEISVPDATTSTKGVVKYGNNFGINGNGQLSVNLGANVTTDANGAITVPDAGSVNKGVVNTETVLSGSPLVVPTSQAVHDALQNVSIPDATTVSKGKVQVGSNIDVSNGVISVPQADANTATKGVVTIDGLSSNLTLSNGVLDVPTGTTSTKGVLSVGDNLEVSSGVVSVPKATQLSRGVVVPALSGAITATNDGEIDVQTATTSAKGVVTLTSSITDGDTTHVPTADAVYDAITGATIADATTTSKGIVQIGANLDISQGLLSVPVASSLFKGVVQTGANISNNNGTISIPTAQSGIKGVVAVGANLDIDNNGNLSVPTGSDSNLGVLKTKQNGTIYASSNGELDINSATTTTAGAIIVGNNLDINNGVLSVPDATTTTIGAVQKTAYVRDNDYNVPTSKAVYDAIQSGSIGRFLLPTTRENWVSGADCFWCNENSNKVLNSNDISPVSDTIIGSKSFSNAHGYTYLWIKRELIDPDLNLPEYRARCNAFFNCETYSGTSLGRLSYIGTFTDLSGNTTEYFVYTGLANCIYTIII